MEGGRYVSAVVILLLIGFSLVVYGIATSGRQHDFLTYYSAAKAYSMGLNPYNNDILSYVADARINFPYVYPPVVLYLFKPLLLLDYQTSYLLYLALKVVCILLLVGLWRKYFLPSPEYAIVLYVFCALAFNGTILRDLNAGNVSIFEQVFIWSAMVYYLKKKPFAYSFLIALSAMFKITSIALLLMLLLDRNKKSLLAGAAALLVFSSVQFVSYLHDPAMFGDFIKNARSLDEWGYLNPSSLAFIRDIMYHSFGWLFTGAYMDLIFYIPFILILFALTYYSTRKSDFQKNRMDLIIISLFLYALTMPRFKDYSYILLIVPAIHVIHRALSSHLSKLIIIYALCTPPIPNLDRDYKALFLAFVLYLMFLWRVRVSSGEGRNTPVKNAPEKKG